MFASAWGRISGGLKPIALLEIGRPARTVYALSAHWPNLIGASGQHAGG
jgi:hypothetical protein